MKQATKAAASQYTTNEAGERVIAASRRPDGSIRKERRVREGYIPPDEQKTYTSTGTKIQRERDAVKCPGFDDDSAKQAATLSKAAKKNAARKNKGPSGNDAVPAMQNVKLGAADSSSSRPVDQHVVLTDRGDSNQEPASSLPPTLKKIRALQKKVRACQGLLDKQEAGETLSDQENAKLANMPSWLQEIEQLAASQDS